MDGKRGEEKETLHHSYETLKPHLSKANSYKVEQDMLQLEDKWEKLRDALRRKISGVCSVWVWRQVCYGARFMPYDSVGSVS